MNPLLYHLTAFFSGRIPGFTFCCTGAERRRVHRGNYGWLLS
ncbi:hypothetical protein R69919_02435 [Paraburkholderia gardini]|nr:hypothetical protein R69919_02435 [Paraburkholderia gardini]